MARRRAQLPKQYMRCRACHSLVPTKYAICGGCGQDMTRPPIIVVNTLDELRREFEAARLEQLADIGHDGSGT